MPFYRDIIAAAAETATAILCQRANARHHVVMSTDGGTTASVTWDNHTARVGLNMPTMPPDAMLTRAEADRLVAYVAHECCHVLHTDWEAWTRAVRDGDEVRNLVNCLEDVRIEATEIAAGHYPALRGLLASLLTQKHAEALEDATRQGVTIGRKLAHMPYVCAVLGRMANGYTVPTAHALEHDLTPRVRKLVATALRALPRCKDTEAVRQLAHRLLKLAKADTPQEPPRKPQDGPKPPKGADTRQPPQGGQDAPQGQDEGEGEGAGQGDQGEGNQGEGQGQGTSQGEGESQGNPEAGGSAIDPDDLSTMIERANRRYHDGKTIAERAGESFAHLLPLARNEVQRATPYPDTSAASALGAMLPRSSTLHGQIARMLISEEMSRRTHHETSGRLDRRALVRTRTGAPDVYSQREDRPAVQTALVILVDQSSSMSFEAGNTGARGAPTRMTFARATVWALARAAEDAGAAVLIMGFRSKPGQGERSGALLTIVKDWDTPTLRAASSIAGLFTGATTPLSPAIIAAAEMLRERTSATRRITMVVTDGMCDYRAPAVTAACRIAEAMGVETVGIGMACDQIVKTFPNGYSINVESLDQLAKTGLGQLVRMLEDADRGR